MTFKKAFRLSLIGHVLLMWIALGTPIGCSQGGSDAQSQEQGKEQTSAKPHKEENIAEKEQPEEVEVEITHRSIEKSEEQLAMEASMRKQEECKPYFGGIGIMHDPFDAIVTKVYKYYPAHRAGILEGDQILNVNDIRGPVGTQVMVQVVRNGIRFDVAITRGRICLEDARKETP